MTPQTRRWPAPTAPATEHEPSPEVNRYADRSARHRAYSAIELELAALVAARPQVLEHELAELRDTLTARCA